MAMLAPMKKHTEIYENHIRLKLFKALEFSSRYALIPKSELFTSMNANKALYLIVYYCCVNGDNLMAIYAGLLLEEHSDAHSDEELLLWLNQTFVFIQNHLKCVIYTLFKIKANYVLLPDHIIRIFLCHGGYTSLDTFDFYYEMVVLDDNSPLKEDSVEILQSTTYFPALLDAFVKPFETKLQKMFEHIKKHLRATENTGFTMSASTPYILTLFYGLLSHDVVACLLVMSLFLNTTYGRSEDIVTLNSENIFIWLMSTFNFDQNIFDGAIKCMDQLIRIHHTPNLEESSDLAYKKFFLTLEMNFNSKKPVQHTTLLPRIRLESFDLNKRAHTRLCKSVWMQPRLTINKLLVPRFNTASELLSSVCSDSCKTAFKICQETFWIPEEARKEIIGIFKRICDVMPTRDSSLYTNIHKIIKIKWLSKGYQLPVSSNDLCNKCFIKLFGINTTLPDKTLEGVPLSSPEGFFGLFPTESMTVEMETEVSAISKYIHGCQR